MGGWTNVTCFHTSHGPWRGLPEGPNDVNNKGFGGGTWRGPLFGSSVK